LTKQQPNNKKIGKERN